MAVSPAQGISLKGALLAQLPTVNDAAAQMQSSIFYSLCSIKCVLLTLCSSLCFSSVVYLFLLHGGLLSGLLVLPSLYILGGFLHFFIPLTKSRNYI